MSEVERMRVYFTLSRNAVLWKLGLLVPAVVVLGGVAGLVATFVAVPFAPAALLVGGVFFVGIFAYGAVAVDAIQQNLHAAQMADNSRKQAEADAIKAAAERAQVVNVNSGSGTQKNINKPIQYRVGGVVQNQLSLNQTTNQIDQRKIEIPAADVRWFVEQLAGGYGHSKSKWVSKVELPYSRQPVTYEIYRSLIDAITDAGGIIGRGERASGTLIEKEPAQLVKMIEASYPGASSKGVTLELSAGSAVQNQ